MQPAIFCILSATVLLVAILPVTVVNAGKGSVALDSLTFDKVIRKFKATLVKFDQMYPYGDKHDAYMEVAEAAKNAPDLLIAEVGIQDYGDRDNADLADRFQVNKDDYPVVYLFLSDRDSKNPIRFPSTESFDANSLKRFVSSNAGLRLPLDGCLEQFDTLAEQFMATDNKQVQADLLETGKTTVGSLDDEEASKRADVYIKLMQKVIERGNNFIPSERERVKNLLAGRLSDGKKEEMQKRLNVLTSFLPAGSTSTADKTEL